MAVELFVIEMRLIGGWPPYRVYFNREQGIVDNIADATRLDKVEADEILGKDSGSLVYAEFKQRRVVRVSS